MKKKCKKPIIGFLVSGIMDEFTMKICQGAIQAARTLDVNIVVMPGKYLDRDLTGNRDIMYEYQHNTIFSYAEKENVDAILVAADCIGCLTTRDRLERLMKTYEGIPTVLVASKLEGYVNVTYDNCTGIRTGMEYLINVLKCRRFGMIGGPDSNFDASERKSIFLQVLSEHNIPFCEENYIAGDLSRNSREVSGILLDRNPDLEAIVCVNDETALGLYEELRHRNIVPGKDISVLGYDDTINATKINPSLSSVAADPVELGEQGLKLLLQILEGKSAESLVLPTKFILRHSFCSPIDGIEEEEKPIDALYSVDASFDEIFYRYTHEEYQHEMEPLRVSYRRLMETVRQESATTEEILVCLDAFLDKDAVRYADIGIMLNTLERIYHRFLERQPDIQGSRKLQEVFSVIYRRIIRSMDYELGAMRERDVAENYAMKLFIRDMLQFERGNDQSYYALLDNLEWLKIKNAFLYTFKKPIIHLNGEKFALPRQLYLKAVLRDGKPFNVPFQKQKQSIENIFHNSFMEPDKRYALVLLPLFSNELLYGVLLCDLSNPIYDNGEFLVNQMSSAVKVIQLLRTNEQIQQQLEDNLVTLRENNIELDTLSKSDSLTGILNRRGFEDGANKLLAESRKSGESVLVVYVDMNNLKIINDRYGHEEGDFSIISIAETLKTVVGELGVVGRIGGDEFACLLPYQDDDDGKSLLSKIYNSFDDFNAVSSKSYNITVSAGAVKLPPDSDLSLAGALGEADERLYRVKRFRTKEVAKNK